jgi:hypothetical protein
VVLLLLLLLLLLQVWLVLAWLLVVLRVLVRGRWQPGDGAAAARCSRRFAAHLAAEDPVCDSKKRQERLSCAAETRLGEPIDCSARACSLGNLQLQVLAASNYRQV